MPSSETLEILLRLKDAASKGLDEVNAELKNTQKTASSADLELAQLQQEMRKLGQRADKVTSDIDDLNRSAARTAKTFATLQRAGSLMRRGIRGVSGAIFSLKGAFAGLGVGLLARSFVQAASSAEQYRTRLTVILGSQAKANELFQSMAEYASTVSFEYQDIIGSATQLAGVLKGGTAEVEKYMPIIADLAATTGLGIQETTTQVIRMYSAGAASADLFRERGVLSMLGFQAGVSHSAEETRKKLIAAFEDPQSKFAGASAALARTWGGMLSMLSDSWFQFRNLVMEAGVFDFIRAALSTFLEYIKQLRKEGRLDQWARSMADGVITALEGIIKAVALLVDSFRGLQLIWNSLKVGFGLFAKVINLGMAGVYDIVDQVRVKLRELGVDAQKLGSILKYLPGTQSLGLMLEGLEMSNVEIGKMGDHLRNQAQWWDDVVEESSKELSVLSEKESAWSRVNTLLEKIRAKAAEYRAEAEKAGKAPGQARIQLTPELGRFDALKSELTRLKATTATALTELGIFYENSKISLDKYFNERLDLLTTGYQKERQILKAQLETLGVEDPKKRQQQLDKIFVLDQKYEQDKMKLLEERRKAEIKAAQDVRAIQESLATIRSRIIAPADTESRFAEERAAMERAHAEEQQQLITHKASLDQIEEAHRLQQLEKDKLAADQRQQVLDMYLEGAMTSIGYLNEAFGDLYEASGQQIKEFFYLQKAAAIAQTVIQTYQNAVLAYQQGLQIPYVGIYLAPIFAATAVAAGMAKVAAIASQSLAEGGKVRTGKVIRLDDYRQGGGKIKGTSPHPKADNVTINATAGEFMHPVKSVKYYGERAMELIQKRRIPKEVFEGYAHGGTVFKRSETVIKGVQRLADGGMVLGHSPQSTSDNITINATAGEFIHPVDVVKHYSRRGMEAIRQKVIPREAIMNFAANIRPPQTNYSYAFQTGGAVGGVDGQKPKESGQNINVVNVVDPNMMDQYVSTTHGQKNILNVISQNSFAVKQILAAE